MRVGIDLGGTKIVAVALDGSVEVARALVDTPRDDYEGTLDAIIGVVTALEQRIPHAACPPKLEERGPESRFPSVGVGIPGTISPSTGRVKNANSTWLIGQPLLQDLESRLGRRVRIANDANCFAMSEAADGAGKGANVVFGVIAGTGAGAGIVVRRHLLTGPNAIAGEWGHNSLPWAREDETPGPACYCGKHGCIETFLSGPAMTADHARRTGLRLSPPEIVSRAAAGESRAEETMARYEERMARALASVINVLDPDVIVLGGGMSNIERLYENVPRLWGAYVFACGTSLHGSSRDPQGLAPLEKDPVRTRFVRARHGDSSGVRGAAWLWPAAP